MTRNPDDVKAGVAATQQQITDACARVGRDPRDVEIVAAVKYLAIEDLPLLHAAGIRRVGENRTDQLTAKQAAHGDLFRWDFIGNLQSRKVKEIVGRVTLIHSLFTESTADQLQSRSLAPQDVLIEVNVAGDPDKDGVAPTDLDALLERLAPQSNIRVQGLMTMPAFAVEPEASRLAFRALHALADQASERWVGVHQFAQLSMGTSQDFVIAVEEGATLVRAGSVLLGPSDTRP
ncbi:MAG: YggS family pyridoxal phosphate-dependent enzyme [Thermoleophilia bacterium]|nr:YggS family pyridoxal phosphate-dependent enzyme [Thermoleophilia bacterium]